MDHFECYGVKIAKGTPALPKGLELTIGDAFTDPPRRYVVKKPVRLCTPVARSGFPAQHAEHLLCYQVKAAKGRCAAGAPQNAGAGCKKETDCGGIKGQTILCVKQLKPGKTSALGTANQFGTGLLDVEKDGEVCLPSFR